ncbi:Ldh family oxidoreductase [Paracoccus aerodenitrificans]|uniref:Ldh family oxidoreductase n=1 Tax=Paracoccus aerodenitrificans TaxID=3017781 RepID=UPI0022EFE32D|nr:Ldh family oxidoreductase [Paracoccus aerodenitrificans]WBU63739.1 Ldh family oxidoreductase [Paracoccus aerodenitrificans]
MAEGIVIGVDDLERQVAAIFSDAGLTRLQADCVARVIVAGERDACKSHGIYRIEGCLRTVAAEKVDPKAVPELADDGTAVIRVDAKGAFSPAAFAMGAPVLAQRAKELGLAALVINSCTHFSALWPEIEVLTDQGLAAMAMCPSYSSVAPTGGNAALLGTSPIAFGWPRPDRPPYVFDIATSVVARGEIELHRRSGKPMPEGWAIDKAGAPTTDPEAALQGALLPFGGHKGSAISTMIELLAGAMIGDLTSPEAMDYLGDMSLLPHHGELVLAFSPEKFSASRTDDPFQRAEMLLEAIIGQGARLPSQRRFAAREISLRDGISLSTKEIDSLERLRQDALRIGKTG